MTLDEIWIGGFFFGAVNGAVGVAVTWAVVTLIHAVFRWIRDRAVAH